MAVEEIPALVSSLRRSWDSGKTRPLSWRVSQLERLKAMMQEREAELAAALQADLGKCPFESWGTEINIVASEVEHTLTHLSSWARPEKVSTPLVQQPGHCRVLREPLGVVLIIAPWNYPVQLVLAPLVGALAAGNCAVLKPSELTPRCSEALARWLPEYLDPSCVRVVEGGIPETSALLKERFDHIFFTGGEAVGKIVMRAASEHLTPVTLELGGKSPCVVDSQVDLEVAARRIAWGKAINAGQTCVAPDYVLVHESQEEALIKRIQAAWVEFFGPDAQTSPDYGRIVSERHFRRLEGLLEGQEVVAGGKRDADDRFFAPTLVRAPALDSALMTEEIFGPILPVLRVRDLEEAISFINARPKPLALYLFSNNREHQEALLARTSSGGACINETLMHLGVAELPFGGVGASGMGAYHGRASFETFSHRRSVLYKSTRIDPAIRYPPYEPSKTRWARRLF
jgi:aldehyde dehydrogenase (NAD+)